MLQYIAERKLIYTLKGSNVKREFIIRLSAPYFVKESTVNFPVGDDGCSACHIDIKGLDESYPEVYGADSLQAVSLASVAIESFLKRLKKKYNFYYLNGESYFDD